MMTVKQASERLNVSVATVYALVSAGKLACHRVGVGKGRIRITESDIEAYLSLCRQDTVAAPSRQMTPRKLKHIRI